MQIKSRKTGLNSTLIRLKMSCLIRSYYSLSISADMTINQSISIRLMLIQQWKNCLVSFAFTANIVFILWIPRHASYQHQCLPSYLETKTNHKQKDKIGQTINTEVETKKLTNFIPCTSKSNHKQKMSMKMYSSVVPSRLKLLVFFYFLSSFSWFNRKSK